MRGVGIHHCRHFGIRCSTIYASEKAMSTGTKEEFSTDTIAVYSPENISTYKSAFLTGNC